MAEPPPKSVDVSILMVNWNTRGMTLACLASVYEQTRRVSFEIILVDNASKDGSAAAIGHAYPGIKLLQEPVNHGFAGGNNIAAGQAQGRYLLLLNTDTVILDGAIDRIVAFADAHADARIWGGRTLFADGTPNPTACWGRITPWSSFCLATGLTTIARTSPIFNPEGVGAWGGDSERHVDIVSGCFFLIDAQLWRELGGFDRSFFMYGEEADLCARGRGVGARPMITPAATIVHHGGGSATRRADTLIYLSGARIELAKRHLSPLGGRFSRGMIILAALWRSAAYRVVARLRPRDRFKRSAALWREAWARRDEWKNGALAKPL